MAALLLKALQYLSAALHWSLREQVDPGQTRIHREPDGSGNTVPWSFCIFCLLTLGMYNTKEMQAGEAYTKTGTDAGPGAVQQLGSCFLALPYSCGYTVLYCSGSARRPILSAGYRWVCYWVWAFPCVKSIARVYVSMGPSPKPQPLLTNNPSLL